MTEGPAHSTREPVEDPATIDLLVREAVAMNCSEHVRCISSSHLTEFASNRLMIHS